MFDPATKTLVADDMAMMRKVVTKALKEIGFTSMQEAPDGAAAWNLLQGETPPFQLIISDWNMPGMTGLEFLKKTRADARFKTIPFLMVTAESEGKQVMEAIQAGVSNYIVKPFTKDTLREKLEVMWKKTQGAK